MTVKYSYACDLCSLSLKTHELIGIHWAHDRKIGELPAPDAKAHICLACLDSLLEIAASKGYCTLTKYGNDKS